jgi:hypothetical protein
MRVREAGAQRIVVAGLTFAVACGWVPSRVAFRPFEEQIAAQWSPNKPLDLARSELPTAFAANRYPHERLTVVRDGKRERLRAVVVERVYAPDGGIGGPLSRRWLSAWRDDGRYAVFAGTELDPGSIRRKTSFERDDALAPPAVLMMPSGDPGESWLPRAGSLRIAREPGSGECPFTFLDDGVPLSARQQVICQIIWYDVELDADAISRGDLRDGPDTAANAARRTTTHHIRIRRQRVPGIRFTVRCRDGEKPEMWNVFDPCLGSPIQFWRDNALYTPSLGVDVSRMKKGTSMGEFCALVRTGEFAMPPSGRVLLRWTVSAPDGRQLVRDSTAEVPPSWLSFDYYRNVPIGGRVQCLFPGYLLPFRSSRFSVAVVDLEADALP